MKNIFDYDNPLIITLERIGNEIILGILCLLFCIPLITIVPSCAAAYHTAVKVVRAGGNGVVKDFVSSFVSSLKQGIILSFLAIAAGLLIYTGINMGWQLMSRSLIWKIYFYMGILIGIIVLGWLIYLPALLSRFQMKSAELMRASLLLVIHKPWKALLLSVLLCIFGFAVWYFPSSIILLPGVFVELCGTIEEPELQRLEEQYAPAGSDEDHDGLQEQEEQEITPFELNEIMEKRRRAEKRSHE